MKLTTSLTALTLLPLIHCAILPPPIVSGPSNAESYRLLSKRTAIPQPESNIVYTRPGPSNAESDHALSRRSAILPPTTKLGPSNYDFENKLSKRGFFSNWALRITVNRFGSGTGHDGMSCLKDELTTKTSERSLRFPRRGSAKDVGTDLPICVDTMECFGEGEAMRRRNDSPAQSDTTPKAALVGEEQDARWYVAGGAVYKRYNNCPATEEALVDRMLAVAKELKWSPELTVEEAYEGLHKIDPELFPYATYEEKLRAASGSDETMEKMPESTNDPTQEDETTEKVSKSANGPTQEGVKKNCKKWYTATAEDSCWSIAEDNNVKLKKFYRWNPAVNADGECTQLWIGYAYCVKN